MTDSHQLSRRERQIMDILYAREGATVMEVLEDLSDPPTDKAVRRLLQILEEKGHVRHRQQGPRYLYAATVPREAAKRSAVQHLIGLQIIHLK